GLRGVVRQRGARSTPTDVRSRSDLHRTCSVAQREVMASRWRSGATGRERGPGRTLLKLRLDGVESSSDGGFDIDALGRVRSEVELDPAESLEDVVEDQGRKSGDHGHRDRPAGDDQRPGETETHRADAHRVAGAQIGGDAVDLVEEATLSGDRDH